LTAVQGSQDRRFWLPERIALLATLPLFAFLFVQFFWPVGLLLGTSVTEPGWGCSTSRVSSVSPPIQRSFSTRSNSPSP